jgi:hypothetical protein
LSVLLLPAVRLLVVLLVCCVCAAVKTLDRDFFMDPADAKKWGLIDTVIEHRPLETAVAS